jgi:hypothetical protein
VPLKPVTIELSVERETPASEGRPARRIRLTAQFAPGSTDGLPSAEELSTALQELTDRLDDGLGRDEALSPAVSSSDRSLEDLVENYRPRQVELIDLLLEEGEVSPAEHERLREFLLEERTGELPSSGSTVAATDPVVTKTPSDRAPPPVRSVDELLRAYQIGSLRQAGAVRGRREISYDEYMLLKRHFSAAPDPGSSPR